MSKSQRANGRAVTTDQIFLERPRIHRLMEKAVEGHVLIVSAGEGYGKTYAVNSFLRQRPETAVWIQLSERDNHPWRFWENYTNAMGRRKARVGKELREIGFPETAQQFAKWFEIERREFSFPGKYVIVGDDFHRVTSRAVLDFIQRTMHSPIPNHTLILISRSEPALNLIPVLAKGRLDRLGAEDLLFTEEEIADYFRLRGIDLSGEELAAIHRDTEGWPLAMGLMATEIQKSGGGYTRPLLEKGVFRIFEDDLFSSVAAEVRQYLLKLSLFEQWPLELLERTAATLPDQYRYMPALLAELEKLGAFVRYDYYLQGYRIHQMFLEYLREKQRRLPPAEIKATCAIAARWCLENNLKMDAAINLERAGDCAGLAGIVDSFPRIIPRSAAAPLLEIIERMINRADQDAEDEHCIYLRYVVRGRLLICLSRYDDAAAAFRESISRFEALPPSPTASRVLAESWDYLSVITLIGRRLGRRIGGRESYLSCMERAGHYYAQHPWPLPKSMTMYSIASYVAQIGYPAEAGLFERRVRAFAKSVQKAGNPLNGYLVGLDALVFAELTYFQGDLNAAERYSLEAVIKAREKDQYEIANRALFFLLRICLHRGSLEDLLNIVKQKDALAANSDYLNRDAINDIIDGWLYAHLGEPKKTASWLGSRYEAGDLYSMFRNFEALVRAKCLFAEKRFAEAADFLGLTENRQGLGTFLLGMIEMICLAAAARFRLGEAQAALDLLEKAYHAASPNSLNMPFIELGHDMRSLASIALNARVSIPRPWLEDIRKRASAYGKSLFAVAEQYRSGETVREQVYLTRQERAVLIGLSHGRTREEIAAAAGQPLSAVKSLISRICEKLGAVNRADAIRIASGMGILE
jgi:LuxR family maltose regulon positive regulatory protein